MSRRPGQLSPNGLPVRLLDLLETEDRPLPLVWLANRLDADPESTRRALHRLKDRGLVFLHDSKWGLRPVPQWEWRGPVGHTRWAQTETKWVYEDV